MVPAGVVRRVNGRPHCEGAREALDFAGGKGIRGGHEIRAVETVGRHDLHLQRAARAPVAESGRFGGVGGGLGAAEEAAAGHSAAVLNLIAAPAAAAGPGAVLPLLHKGAVGRPRGLEVSTLFDPDRAALPCHPVAADVHLAIDGDTLGPFEGHHTAHLVPFLVQPHAETQQAILALEPVLLLPSNDHQVQRRPPFPRQHGQLLLRRHGQRSGEGRADLQGSSGTPGP
mmetsp:Transcript_9019/g.27784  ORF Transcript_9019/g.27784 Transcript_9019/m.27784 type:complete len:228 (+) Transcript_9019:790-1473(+)